MESIEPIPPSLSRGLSAPPVQRLERVSRERDRPRRRREEGPQREGEPPEEPQQGPDGDERPRIDVRA